MKNRPKSLLDILIMAPWWVSLVLGAIVFVGLRYVLPGVAGGNMIAQGLVKGLPPLAHWFALPFVLLAGGAALFGARRRRLVDQQTSLESLRSVSWKDFEFMVAEAFRRRGYLVEYSLGAGADGGVDLVLRKDGRKSFVQCKQWRTQSVGAPIIREQFGILTAEGADEVFVITSGTFTAEAVAFARGKPVRLIDGPELLALIRSVQSAAPAGAAPAIPSTASAVATPDCPNCGRPMVKRTSRKGGNAGRQFWGCPSFPQCRGTRPA